MPYYHGVYTREQATSLLPPVRVDVSMPVIVGTAPVHTLEDGVEMAINKPELIFTMAEAVARFGADAPGFTIGPGFPRSAIPRTKAFRTGLRPISACWLTACRMRGMNWFWTPSRPPI